MQNKTTNMKFETKDLLNEVELEIMITSIFTDDKSELIASKISKYIFSYKKCLYRLQTNNTYLCLEGDLKDLLTVEVSSYLSTSARALDSVIQQNLNLKYKKEFVCTFSNAKISTYALQLMNRFKKDDIVLDVTLNEIHFNNGYMDLKTLEFKQRDLTKHFITRYIKRNYTKSNEKNRNIMMKEVRKIIPNNEDLEAILMEFGSALTGESSRDQSALFFLGLGSAGKSILMKLAKYVLECYLLEMKSDAFSMGSKTDKIMNSYLTAVCARITWINEIKDIKMDISLFKEFVEGVLQTTQLYSDGMCHITHYSKLFGTANTMPNIHIDSGTSRRIKGITCKSEFTDESEGKPKVDHSKHIYKDDKHFITNFEKNEGLLNAWFDILSSYSARWITGEKIKYSDNFIETKSTIVSTNDTTQDFIDSYIKITNEDKDRIGKLEMMRLFKIMYPQKFISPQQLLGDLKNHKIMYMSKYRCENIQGCYVGVKLRDNKNDGPKWIGNNKNNMDDYYAQLEDENMKLKKQLQLSKQSEVDKLIDTITKDLETRKKLREEETKMINNMKAPEDESDSDDDDEFELDDGTTYKTEYADKITYRMDDIFI
jgi:hypothetical protein